MLSMLFLKVSQRDATEKLAHQVPAQAAASDRWAEETSGDPHEEEKDETHQSGKGHVGGKDLLRNLPRPKWPLNLPVNIGGVVLSQAQSSSPWFLPIKVLPECLVSMATLIRVPVPLLCCSRRCSRAAHFT